MPRSHPMPPPPTPPHATQQGVSLMVVMLILVVVSILGISGIQIAMMAERSARNDRDYQIAWQSSEAALLDAEMDIEGRPAGAPNLRDSVFNAQPDMQALSATCGTSGKLRGVCDSTNETASTLPIWLRVDFTDTSASAPTTAFGTFTGRSLPAGGAGVQPAKLPRYLIEMVRERQATSAQPPVVFRITAMGFGPNPETQVVLQTIYRK